MSPNETEQRRGHRYSENRQSTGIPSIISIESASITLTTDGLGWRCSRSVAGSRRTLGSPGTTRWAVLRISGRNCARNNERYLLAVPSNLLIRDIEVTPPEYSGRGRHPKVPFTRLDRWCRALPESAWTRIDVRDGEKGPLVIEAVKRRVQARTETGGTGPEELLFVTRGRQEDSTYKHDYYFSNADPGTSLKELARVAKAEHRVEECIKRAKGEAGLADSQGRNWIAWHHHQILALLAAWFLTQETLREKKITPALTSPQLQKLIAGVIEYHLGINHPSFLCRQSTRWLRRNEEARLHAHCSRNMLPRLKIHLRL